MALRIWLPLNGTLENQGLSNYVLQTMGTNITFNNAGKMGQSITFPNSPANCLYVKGGLKMQNLTWTCWFKSIGAGNGTSQRILSEGRDTGSRGVEIWLSKDGLTLNTFARGKNFSTAVTLDAWHHVALVAGDEEVSFYLDGVLINTQPPAMLNDYNQSSDAFVIGKMSYNYTNTNNYFPFNGYINDVRIYDECLSQKQIKEISKGLGAHYKLEGIGINENLILRSDKITSGGQASGITRTYMEDGSMKIVSTSGNGNWCSLGFAENSNTNVGNKLEVGDIYTISCDIKVEEGSVFPTLFINNGNGYRRLGGANLQLNVWQRVYYTNIWNNPGTGYGNISLHLGFSEAFGTYYFKNFKLEKGSFTPWIPAPTDYLYLALGYNNIIAKDVSGNKYDGKINGTLNYNVDSPRYSGSINFNSGWIHYLPSPINSSTDAFTFTCWFYPTQRSTMALYNDRTAVGDGFSVFYLDGGIRFDTGASAQFQSGSIILNTWNFVACVFDKNNNIKKTYINGVQVGSTSTIGSLAKVGINASIGNSSTNGAAGAGNQIYGSLSDVRIYCTAFSADEILTIYENSGIIDNKNNVYTYKFKEE